MTFPKKTVSLYHLPTTVGSTQSYPSTADETERGMVLPLNRQALALDGLTGTDAWEIYFAPTVDVRLQDKAIVSGDTSTYYVKHIFKADFGGLPHKRATVSTQK